MVHPFNRDVRFLYGHVIGSDVVIILVVDIDPVLRALGSEGAIATTGLA
jgi:hypothetical protein